MRKETKLRVMTYNMRHAKDPAPHSWEERVPLIWELLNREVPDLIGTQECFYSQVQDMLSILPEHTWLGLGRKGGSKSEFCAIFYRQDRFDVMEYDHYWLSDTPDLIGSTTWGHTAPRMVTWGRFRDRLTDQQFYFCNTHLDHLSEEARVKGAELIIAKAAQFDEALPVIVTGDFNTGPNSQPYKTFIQSGSFVDSWDAAGERIGGELGTFNHFRDPQGYGPAKRIDWIMLRGDVEAEQTRIVNDNANGRFPSDHFPVVSELRLR